MNESVITVENLSKRYRLGISRHDTLRDRIMAGLRGLTSARNSNGSNPQDFWALREVGFEVRQGEVLGIIGRNGAGKSTLLKILSRITEPTTGRIKIRGRVASLLEVGTGFHPELTGRENIFLNGAILGMSRAEIRRKFDEIVAFAEVERFLDTPVKHYSSGMYVRLAFAVAAHLEPEILIVDEVLAVGDAEFQKKCLGKMEKVATTSGKTVLFVSHNMDAVIRLCTKTLVLQSGRAVALADTESAVREYLSENTEVTGYRAAKSKQFGLMEVKVDPPTPTNPDLAITITFRCDRVLQQPTLGVVVYGLNGVPLFGSNSLFHPWSRETGPQTNGVAEIRFRAAPLWSGTYKASFWLADHTRTIDTVVDAVTFDVVSSHLPAGAPAPKDIGSIHVPGEWTLVQ